MCVPYMYEYMYLNGDVHMHGCSGERVRLMFLEFCCGHLLCVSVCMFAYMWVLVTMHPLSHEVFRNIWLCGGVEMCSLCEYAV